MLTLKERFAQFLQGTFNQSPYAGTFTEHINERIASPFFVSFLGVWIIKNYKLFFGLIFFDSNEGCVSRYEFINYMVDNSPKGSLFWCPLIYSLIAVLFFYLFDQIPKIIRVFVRRKIEPFWVQKIDIDKVVLREDAEKTFKENIDLKIKGQELLEKLHKESVNHQETKIDIDSLKSQNENLQIDVQKKDSEIKKNISEHKSKINELNKTIDSQNELINKLENKNVELRDRVNKIDLYNPSKSISYEQTFSYTIEDFYALWKTKGATNTMLYAFQRSDSIINNFIETSADSAKPNFSDVPMDYYLNSSKKINSGLCEIIYKPVREKNFKLYMRLKMIDSTDDFWFRINMTDTNKVAKLVTYGSGRMEEFDIYSKYKEIENGWYCLHFDINKEFQNSFYKHELSLESVTGFRIRGSVGIARIRIYNAKEENSVIMNPQS